MKCFQKGFLFLSCLFAVSGLMKASELPQGLFGQELGRTISRESITEILKAPDGSRLFGFNPTHPEFPLEIFSRHYLQITPLTGKIISIWGTSKHLKGEECEEVQKMLVIMIRHTFSLDEMARQFHRGLVKGNRVMAAVCMGIEKNLLVFSLTNMDLLQTSNQERKEILKQRRQRFRKTNR